MATPSTDDDSDDDQDDSESNQSDDSDEKPAPKRTTRNPSGRGSNSKRGRPARGRPSSGKPSPAQDIKGSTDENDYVIADLDDPFSVLFDQIVLMVDADGDPICGPFLTLPSKRDYADYYDEIEKPIGRVTQKWKIWIRSKIWFFFIKSNTIS